VSKKGLIFVIIGIPLFIWGVISALNTFKTKMNIIDWLVTKLAPKLPPLWGDLIRVLAIGLLILFVFSLPKAIEELASKYL
jgi:hypothetical protein